MTIERGQRLELVITETADEVIVSVARAIQPGKGALSAAVREDRLRQDKPTRALFCTPRVRAMLRRRGWREDGADMVHDPKEATP